MWCGVESAERSSCLASNRGNEEGSLKASTHILPPEKPPKPRKPRKATREGKSQTCRKITKHDGDVITVNVRWLEMQQDFAIRVYQV